MASPRAACLRPCGLLLALSAPRHGDFPRSIAGSGLPVCALRSRASPAPNRHHHIWPNPLNCQETDHLLRNAVAKDLKEGMRRMSPVRLAPPYEERSRHGCAAASDPNPPIWLCQEASPQTAGPGPCGLPPALSAQGHGDFPRSLKGRSELLVCALRSRASPALQEKRVQEDCRMTWPSRKQNMLSGLCLPVPPYLVPLLSPSYS